jgi:hypothetical protein
VIKLSKKENFKMKIKTGSLPRRNIKPLVGRNQRQRGGKNGSFFRSYCIDQA